jgi:hypothetical protein
MIFRLTQINYTELELRSCALFPSRCTGFGKGTALLTVHKLTPFSIAGVHRRMYRRAYYGGYGSYYGGYHRPYYGYAYGYHRPYYAYGYHPY